MSTPSAVPSDIKKNSSTAQNQFDHEMKVFFLELDKIK